VGGGRAGRLAPPANGVFKALQRRAGGTGYSAGMDTATTALRRTPPPAPARHHPLVAVERLVQGQATSDGAGVKLVRVLTHDLQRRLDPFLMLDAFGTDNPGDYIGGFPDHPHRGFETVTYMLQGRMRHRDSAGNVGLLVPGSVQWMTAGRGVIHSEMPEQEDGAMEGFQLWLNLPGKNKMMAPWYRDIASEEIPEWHGEGVTARVIAGATHGVAGAVQREHTEPLYLDLHLAPAPASSSRCRPCTTPSRTSTAAAWWWPAPSCAAAAWPSWPTRGPTFSVGAGRARSPTAWCCRPAPRARAPSSSPAGRCASRSRSTGPS
jgi:hypothetical protein